MVVTPYKVNWLTSVLCQWRIQDFLASGGRRGHKYNQSLTRITKCSSGPCIIKTRWFYKYPMLLRHRSCDLFQVAIYLNKSQPSIRRGQGVPDLFWRPEEGAPVPLDPPLYATFNAIGYRHWTRTPKHDREETNKTLHLYSINTQTNCLRSLFRTAMPLLTNSTLERGKKKRLVKYCFRSRSCIWYLRISFCSLTSQWNYRMQFYQTYCSLEFVGVELYYLRVM